MSVFDFLMILITGIPLVALAVGGIIMMFGKDKKRQQ